MGESDGTVSGGSSAGQDEDAGRYEIFATLGRGGMADVFLAVSRGPRGFNKLVVLKKLRAHLTEDPSFREMFLDEARLAARLNHPNVVLSYEVGEGNGGYFITMEYLDGQPLNRLLDHLKKDGGQLDPALAARIVADACSGLAHAHELSDYDGSPLKIIHRDVSPHNIFLTYEGQVKLVDFGIAKASLSRAETEVGVLKGKVAYMAPEQAMGGEIDSRADLFAMGLVLWEMLAGRSLYSTDNAANTLHRLMNEPMPPPSSVRPSIDPALEAIVMRALEKDRDKRFAKARDMRDELEAWLRAQNHTVRNQDVGTLLSSRFEAQRSQTQREIRKYMADGSGVRGRQMSLASLEAAERGGGSGAAGLMDLSPGSGRTRAGGSKSSTLTRTAVGKSRRPVAIVLALLAILIVLLLLMWRRGGPPPPAVAANPPPSPPLTTAPAAPPAAAPIAAPPPSASPAPVASAAPSASTAPAATHASGTEPPGHGSHGAHRAAAAAAVPTPAPAPTPAAAPAGPPGYLTLDTYPWTRVSENGRALGTTPLVHVTLSAGSHTLMLDNPDLGIHQSYTATIASGETVTRRLGLR